MRWIAVVTALAAGVLITPAVNAQVTQNAPTPAVPDTPAPSLPTMSPPAKPASPMSGTMKKQGSAGRAAEAAAKDTSTEAPGGRAESTANGSLSTPPDATTTDRPRSAPSRKPGAAPWP
jgi:hypothetical protein